MKTSVFFSRQGQGFFKASLPKHVESFLYQDVVNWAANEKIKKGYYGVFVTDNPNNTPSNQI